MLWWAQRMSRNKKAFLQYGIRHLVCEHRTWENGPCNSTSPTKIHQLLDRYVHLFAPNSNDVARLLDGDRGPAATAVFFEIQ